MQSRFESSPPPYLTRPSRPQQRVVVTGVGALTPLGLSAEETWHRLLAGESGIGKIQGFDTTDISVDIGGEIRGFDPTDWMDRKTARRIARFTQYGLATGSMALKDACLSTYGVDPERAGIVLGTGAGGTDEILDVDEVARKRGYMKISPFSMIAVQYNIAAYHLASEFSMLGPSVTVSTACATGAHAVGEGFRLVRTGEADVVLAGSAEHCLFPLVLAGFAVQRALASRTDEPERASRPFDDNRDGFVLSEGSAMIVLESLEHAIDRGAEIYAEVLGFGCASDGQHPIAPDPGGEHAARAMRIALADACAAPEDVDYVNAHAASTQLGDHAETIAIKRALGDHARNVPVSSTKSMVGHMMGAAGALEAMAIALTIRDQIIHPTINFDDPDPECDLDYVPNVARKADVDIAMSNSIGVGGQNACLVFGRYDPARSFDR
jgi:3-oxoacyl-[acyl-carrier-protein] synthase II